MIIYRAKGLVVVVCTYEQRSAKRTSVNWPVSLWHPKALKFFNGQSMDVSSSGALLVLPMRVPVQEGQNVELNFPRRESLAEVKGCSARIKRGRVIRIDRDETLKSATIKVALEFYPKSAGAGAE
jgi:hypothetical protein